MTNKTKDPKKPAKEAKAPKAPKEIVEKAPKAPGIGDVAKDLIRSGKTNDEVLAGIKAAFPDSNTSMASVNWYRNNLRQAGEKVPTSRELKPKVEKAPKEKKPRGKKAAAEASEAAQAEASGASHLQ